MYAIGISAAALCKNRTLRHMPSGSKTGRYFRGICWDIARLFEMSGPDDPGQGKEKQRIRAAFRGNKKGDYRNIDRACCEIHKNGGIG